MAIKFLADENFDGRIVSGLRRQSPGLDLLRAQGASLSGADDAAVLEHAAAEDRLLLTHDRRTIPRYSLDRVRSGMRMPGVVIVATSSISIQAVIDAILLLAGASWDGEWEGQVLTIP